MDQHETDAIKTKLRLVRQRLRDAISAMQHIISKKLAKRLLQNVDC
jgi:hypothetical protein